MQNPQIKNLASAHLSPPPTVPVASPRLYFCLTGYKLGLPTAPSSGQWCALMAHKTLESSLRNHYLLIRKDITQEQQMGEMPQASLVAGAWGFHELPCLLWGHHPGTSMCSPTRKVSESLQLEFMEASWCRQNRWSMVIHSICSPFPRSEVRGWFF